MIWRKNAYEIEAECINRMIEHFDEEAFLGRSETMTIKDGELINTLRKYTDEEKAFDVHYTLQQER